MGPKGKAKHIIDGHVGRVCRESGDMMRSIELPVIIPQTPSRYGMGRRHTIFIVFLLQLYYFLLFDPMGENRTCTGFV